MCRLLFSKGLLIEQEHFLDALLEMEHGGPDAPGRVYEYENYRLGHNRLSILDIT